MNIFALDDDPIQAARGHAVTYKATHPKHPSTIWAGATAAEYRAEMRGEDL